MNTSSRGGFARLGSHGRRRILPRAVATKNLVRDGSHGLLIAYKVAYQFDFISLRQRVRDVERLRVRSAKFAPARRLVGPTSTGELPYPGGICAIHLDSLRFDYRRWTLRSEHQTVRGPESDEQAARRAAMFYRFDPKVRSERSSQEREAEHLVLSAPGER